MEHLSHFTYGWINPVMGFGFAFAGSLLSLMCMTQARKQFGSVRSAGKRIKWIALASFALGGTAIWMMHFTAMIGFRVTESDIAYDPTITFVSLGVSIGSVFFGLSVAGMGRENTVAKILMAGPLTGLGVVSMHYTGMAAINISGEISQDRTYFWVSVVIAVVAATAALACGMYLDGWKWQTAAAVVMASAISGMHFTGMAGMRVKLIDQGRNAVEGIDPIMLTLPILAVATVGIIVLLFALMGTTPKTVSRREQLGIDLDENDKAVVAPMSPQVSLEHRSKVERQGVIPDQMGGPRTRYPAVDRNREPNPMNPAGRRQMR